MGQNLEQKYRSACIEADMEQLGLDDSCRNTRVFLLYAPCRIYNSKINFNDVFPILREAIKSHGGIYVDGTIDFCKPNTISSLGKFYNRFTINYIGRFDLRISFDWHYHYDVLNEISDFSNIVLSEPNSKKVIRPLLDFHNEYVDENFRKKRKENYEKSLLSSCIMLSC